MSAQPMTTRALTLALRLLTTACAGAALGTMTGCPGLLFDCPDAWSEVSALELGTDAEILAVVAGADYDELIAVGAGGAIVQTKDTQDPQVSNPTNADLRAVAVGGEEIVVVGAAGTILVSADAGESWTAETSPTSDELRGVTYLSAVAMFVAMTQDQVLLRTAAGTWQVVEPPAQGWGQLSALFVTTEEVWLVGSAGSAWSATDPAGAWLRQETGIESDLIAGGRVSGTENSGIDSGLVLASNAGVWFRGAGQSEWTEISVTLDGSIVAYRGGYVVTSNGVIYDIDEGGYINPIANVGLAPRAISATWSGFVVAGEGGRAARATEQLCIGGRPWIIDGQLTTAELVGEIPAHEGSAFDRVLAATWVQDGLYEHASVASFARTARDLMAVGAPAELIRATLAAQGDEIEHARMCFELAVNGAGDPPRGGSLPLGGNFGSVSDPRALTPAAIALAMFDEGCINESLAAAEAAVAASLCSVPRTKRVLERIARDETQHAALAWRTLRWLLSNYRAEVEPVLHQRLARLQLPSPLPCPVIDDDAASFAAHGRLSVRERAAILRRVFAEMIRPVATQMLQRTDAQSLA